MFVEGTSVDEVVEGDPVVLRVPDEDGDEAEDGDEGHDEEGFPTTMLFIPEAKKGEADEFGEVGVFAEHADADGEAGCCPYKRRGVIFVFPEEPGGERPEKYAEGVDGHDESADHKKRNKCGEDDRPEGDFFVEEGAGEFEHKACGACGEEDGYPSDAEDGVAENFCSEKNSPCDTRTLAEITPVEVF